MRSERLDAAVAAQAGLTRAQARNLILAGRVRIGGEPATKPGHGIRPGTLLEIVAVAPYVSRGGEKLAAALAAFKLDVHGARALDIGASTGGFTDALLAHGACHVSAVDVGYGQLAWKLRNDARVHVLERTNFRTIGDDAFAQPFDCIVIDASFISLRLLLPKAARFLRGEGLIVALVKPQFEAGREAVGRGGVVKDPRVHEQVLRTVRDALPALGLVADAVCASPLVGPAGNREFFLLIRRHAAAVTAVTDEAIAQAVAEAPK